MTLDDLILTATGGPTISDGLSSWFTRTTTEALQDAELRWLQSQAGVTATTIPDAWDQFLTGLGYTGSLNDKLYQYWAANQPP